MSYVYLGIDNSQPNNLRIVGVTIEEAWSEELLFAVRYRGEPYRDRQLLRQLARYDLRAVATTPLHHDPFFILARLRLPIYRYSKDELPTLGRTTPAIPSNYKRAAQLAIKLAFQVEGYRRLHDFKWDLSHLNAEIEKLHKACDRLFAFLPVETCPF